MSILRNYLKLNFSMIPNEILTDCSISFGARLLYCYLASKPDNWKIWNADIKKQLGIKDNGTLSKYWKELITHRWLLRERARTADGKLEGGFDYQLNNPYMENHRIREKPVYGETLNYNNTEFNNNINNINNTNNICDLENETGVSIIKDDVQLFFDTYNNTVKRLPKATKLSDARKRKIKARLKNLDIEGWKKVFEKCNNSDFCAGISGSWKADIDWLIANDNNYLKVLEGKYDNKFSLRNGLNNSLEELQQKGMDLL